MAAPKGNQNAKGNRGGGRPSDYDPSILPQIKKACEAGFTDADLALLLGVSETTIGGWKTKHIEFLEALKEGKSVADDEVERSLLERAKGYSHPAEKISFDKDGNELRAQYIEHYPPDPTSMIFWLKNRRRDRWRDKQDHEHSGEVKFSPVLEILPAKKAG